MSFTVFVYLFKHVQYAREWGLHTHAHTQEIAYMCVYIAGISFTLFLPLNLSLLVTITTTLLAVPVVAVLNSAHL